MIRSWKDIQGWFGFAHIYDFALSTLDRTPGYIPTFVELGAYKGRSTAYLATRIYDENRKINFITVDHFKGSPYEGHKLGHADTFAEFTKNIKELGLQKVVKVMNSLVDDAVKEFADESIDFLLVDADHTYEATLRTLQNWFPKVKKGGVIAGDDYDWETVKRAAQEFAQDRKDCYLREDKNNTFIIYKTHTIDAIYCINLEHRKDRWKAVNIEFKKHKLKVKRVEAFKGTIENNPSKLKPGSYGCYVSNLEIYRQALDLGYENILIFQDDVVLSDNFNEDMRTLFSQCPVNFDLCFLGCLMHKDWKNKLIPFDKGLAIVHSGFCAHAYIIPRKTMQAIVDKKDNFQYNIDAFFAREYCPKHKTYSVIPYIANQTAGYSDISNCENSNGDLANMIW